MKDERCTPFPRPLWEAAREKSGLTLELSQRGGGGHGLIQSKTSTFCHRQVPTRYISSYLISMVVLYFPYLINSTLEPSLCVGGIKNNIKNVDLKSAPRWSKVQGGGVFGSFGKVPKSVCFLCVQLPYGKG